MSAIYTKMRRSNVMKMIHGIMLTLSVRVQRSKSAVSTLIILCKDWKWHILLTMFSSLYFTCTENEQLIFMHYSRIYISIYLERHWGSS